MNGIETGFMPEEERSKMIEIYEKEFKEIEKKYQKEIKSLF